MKPYRKDHLHMLDVYQDLAADWADQTIAARLAYLSDPPTRWRDAERERQTIKNCAENAAFWSAAARDLYDEFLEREQNNGWLRVE